MLKSLALFFRTQESLSQGQDNSPSLGEEQREANSSLDPGTFSLPPRVQQGSTGLEIIKPAAFEGHQDSRVPAPRLGVPMASLTY